LWRAVRIARSRFGCPGASVSAVAAWWSSFGLPTRRDQERALHKLNQLESRLYDLEEQLLTQSSKRN